MAALIRRSEEVGIEMLSDDDARQLFDEAARRELGMSGDEFLQRYDAGEYPEADRDPAVMELILLLPFVR